MKQYVIFSLIFKQQYMSEKADNLINLYNAIFRYDVYFGDRYMFCILINNFLYGYIDVQLEANYSYLWVGIFLSEV